MTGRQYGTVRLEGVVVRQPEFGLSEGQGRTSAEVEGRFLGLMAIGNKAAEEIDEEVGGTAVAGVFNLGDIFKLVENGLDNSPFAQQHLVSPQE